MIVCPNCGKENQDHYKFCLGCGSDLPRPEAAAKARPTPTPPTGIPAVEQNVPAPAPEPQPQIAAHDSAEVEPAEEDVQQPSTPTNPPGPAGDSGTACGTCGAPIPPGFAFCGACGAPVPGAILPEPMSSPQVAKDSARLVLIQPDGTEGGHVEIPTSEVAVGRDAGGFFESDPFLSPTHAIFRTDGDEVIVRDAGSLNGIYIKIIPNEPEKIKSGQIYRMGQELMLFEEIDKGSNAPDGTERMGSPIEGLWGRVALIVGQGRLGNAFPVGGDGIVFGRERGNILFPEDGYVSGLHLRLYREGNSYFITDLGSSNGTFIKADDETRLKTGSFLLMGQQLFRVDI